MLLISHYFETFQISRDPTELANWAAINLPIEDKDKLILLSQNSALMRMRYLLDVLNRVSYDNQILYVRSNVF